MMRHECAIMLRYAAHALLIVLLFMMLLLYVSGCHADALR